VCPDTGNSVIRAYKLHKNVHHQLPGTDREASLSIFFIILLGGKVGGKIRMQSMTQRERVEFASKGGVVGGRARAAKL
jgi:hypothetical protein